MMLLNLDYAEQIFQAAVVGVFFRGEINEMVGAVEIVLFDVLLNL